MFLWRTNKNYPSIIIKYPHLFHFKLHFHPLLQPIASTDFNMYKNDDMLQCLYCPLGYSSPTLLERHMRQHHGNLAGADNPVLSSRLARLGNMHALGGRPINPEVIAKQQQMMISNFQYMPNKGIYHAKPIRPRPTKTSATLLGLQEKIRQNIRRENASRSPTGRYFVFKWHAF